MAKITDLFNAGLVSQLLNQYLPSLTPAWSPVRVSKVQAVKKNIRGNYYSLVVAYQVDYQEQGQSHQTMIYCSAHSKESRRQSMENLELLWEKGVPNQQFQTNWPLFYESDYRAVFYLGLSGQNLFQFFKQGGRADILKQVQLVGGWLARLHSLTMGNTQCLNGSRNKIGQVVPGRERALERISQNYPQYYDRFVRIYDLLEAREKNHWPNSDQLAIIHGDLHPENVLVNQQGVAIIDWADASLADPLRDIGSFSQQLIFMGRRQIKSEDYWQKAQLVFEQAYRQAINQTKNTDWRERFKTYYYFAAFRTAVYFVTKSGPSWLPADGLLNEIEANLY